MVIVGTVIEEAMEDRLRVTMIATGLGGAVVAAPRRPPNLQILETVVERTGTDNVGVRVTETIDYEKLDQPAVARRRHPGSIRSVGNSGIPAQAGGLTDAAKSAGALPLAARARRTRGAGKRWRAMLKC